MILLHASDGYVGGVVNFYFFIVKKYIDIFLCNKKNLVYDNWIIIILLYSGDVFV
jgi:hypothetical protein